MEKDQLDVGVAADNASKKLFQKLRYEKTFNVEYSEGEYQRLEKALRSES